MARRKNDRRNRYQHNPTKCRMLHAALVSIRHLSAKEAAEQTGVSIATIYNWRRLKYCPSSATFHMVLIAMGKKIKVVDATDED